MLPEGEEKARRLGERLRGIDFSAVYSSPRRRARHTAELAGFASPQVTPLLSEYDYGDYEGITTKEIRKSRPRWELFRDGCPNGETPSQVYERARGFIEQAVSKTPEGRVIAFAHGHILRTVAAAWIEQPVELAGRLRLDTAGLSILEQADGVRLLRLWNATG